MSFTGAMPLYAADDPCVERLGDQVSRELVDKGNRRLTHAPVNEASCKNPKIVRILIDVDVPVQEIDHGVGVFLLLSNTCKHRSRRRVEGRSPVEGDLIQMVGPDRIFRLKSDFVKHDWHNRLIRILCYKVCDSGSRIGYRVQLTPTEKR